MVKPHLWPLIKMLSSEGHESQHSTRLEAAIFQYIDVCVKTLRKASHVPRKAVFGDM